MIAPVVGTKRTRNVVTPVLTERRHALLHALADFVAAHRYAPTLRQLMPAVGTQSTSSVHHHLNILERAGYVTFDCDAHGFMVTRSLALTEKGREAVEL